jgi:serine/threonine protein kinase
MVLEYFPGAELYDVLLKKHREVTGGMMGLNEQDAKHIIYSLLCALYYLKSHNIAHCDLKLENILASFDITSPSSTNVEATLTESDYRKPRIKLIDFGLAQVVTEDVIIQKGSEPYLVMFKLISAPRSYIEAEV